MAKKRIATYPQKRFLAASYGLSQPNIGVGFVRSRRLLGQDAQDAPATFLRTRKSGFDKALVGYEPNGLIDVD